MEGKNVNMEEKKTFTREEVETIVSGINNQARQQVENIAKRCKYLEDQLTYRDLDYLFKVVDSKSGLFSLDFQSKCVEKIASIMNFSEESEKDKED